MVTRFGDAMVLAEGMFKGCGQTLATGIACPVMVPTGNACPAGLLIAFTWAVPYGSEIVRGAGLAAMYVQKFDIKYLDCLMC